MNDLVQKIGQCVERGKINEISPFPADMKGLEGDDRQSESRGNGSKLKKLKFFRGFHFTCSHYRQS